MGNTSLSEINPPGILTCSPSTQIEPNSPTRVWSDKELEPLVLTYYSTHDPCSTNIRMHYTSILLTCYKPSLTPNTTGSDHC